LIQTAQPGTAWLRSGRHFGLTASAGSLADRRSDCNAYMLV